MEKSCEEGKVKCRKLSSLFLISFSILLAINAVFAMPTVFLPPNKTLAIPDGVKLHLGDYYVQSVGTPIHLVKWLSSNWINYTVDGAGTQTIYYPTTPETVYIDTVHHGIGDGWTYAASIISVTAATGQVQIDFNTVSATPTVPGPQTSSNFDVLFKVSKNGKPVENCQITISTTTYQEYVGEYQTDRQGEATFYLAVGTYDYHAKFEGKTLSGTFQHIEEETITIDFGTGQTTQTPVLDRAQLIRIGVGVIVIIGAVFAITAVTKKKRW